MTHLFKRKPRFLPLLACLTAGSVQAAPDIAAPALQQWSTGKAQALGFLPSGTGDERLAVSKREGLMLLDKQGKTLSRVQAAPWAIRCWWPVTTRTSSKLRCSTSTPRAINGKRRPICLPVTMR